MALIKVTITCYPNQTCDDLTKPERSLHPSILSMNDSSSEMHSIVCYKTCQTWAWSDFDGLLQKLLLGNISSSIGVPREHARIEAQDAHAQHTRARRVTVHISPNTAASRFKVTFRPHTGNLSRATFYLRAMLQLLTRYWNLNRWIQAAQTKWSAYSVTFEPYEDCWGKCCVC